MTLQLAEEREISIRSIQHFLYCPHRWGLIEIDRAWEENFFVTKANQIHNRVHDPKQRYTSKNRKIYTSVPVYNDLVEYNLYGVTDCIETIGDDYCIVEYKPTKPKERTYNLDDLMQVFAQKICVDYVFSCDCTAEIYYADVKRRVPLPLKENYLEYDELLKETLNKMREYLIKGEIPAIQKNQKCSGCSMKNLCMPQLKRVPKVRKQIEMINRKSEEE